MVTATGCCNGESAPPASTDHISTIKTHQIKPALRTLVTGHTIFGNGMRAGSHPAGIGLPGSGLS